MEHRKLLCVIMDGVGETDATFGNAFKFAYTPNLDWLRRNAAYKTIYAHGTYVGLPTDDDIGNSEVGHNAIGAGQIYDQGAKLVQNSIQSGALFTGETWKEMVTKVLDAKSTLHFIGLLSDGNVHSHIEHLFSMMERAVKDGVKRIRIHPLLDGRDVGEKSCEKYIDLLLSKMAELEQSCDIAVASGGGRMTTTMDRYEADWSIVERGWKAHVLGEGEYRFPDIRSAISKFREDASMTDQYFPSFVIEKNNVPVGTIHDHDAVVFFNFRGDRAIEISRAFAESEFTPFDRQRHPKVFYAGMMEYDGDLHIPPRYLVTPPSFTHTLGEYLAHEGVRQFACSETQKYGHVTYFWNGNRSGKFDQKLEDYLEIPSDVIEFNQKPWMKAYEICEATINQMKNPDFNFGRINFANGDMVGHTGDFEAAVAAMITVDIMIGKLVKAAQKTDTILMITADHGNCDEMFDDQESKYPEWSVLNPGHMPRPKTSHTKNKVPLYIYDPRSRNYNWTDIQDAGLAHLAATACLLMGVAPDKHFLPSLLKKA